MNCLGDLEIVSVAMYGEVEAQWALRRTSKRNDVLVRLSVTSSAALRIGRLGFSWPQFRVLRTKFCFAGLRFMTTDFHCVAFPFGEVGDEYEPQICLVELRRLLQDLPSLRCVFQPHASPGRWAEKLDAMPEWGACGRWRFNQFYVGERSHWRVVWFNWRSDLPFPEDTRWVMYIEIRAPRALPVIGRYPRLRQVQLWGEWDGLAEWLEQSETPLLRRINMDDGRDSNNLDPVIALPGTWLRENVVAVIHPHDPQREAVIGALERKYGAKARDGMEDVYMYIGRLFG